MKRKILAVLLSALFPFLMTGCFLFPEDLPNAAESASYLIMVKNAVEGKTQSSDAYEAVVTSPSGRSSFPIRYDQFLYTGDIARIESIALAGELDAIGCGAMSEELEIDARGSFATFQAFPVSVALAEAKVTSTLLQSGVAVTNISGSSGDKKYYRIEVPSGTTKITFQMYGGSGDADLYVKKGSVPTLSSFDGRPYLYGNNETASFQSPQVTTWYVMIHAYAAYSGASLKATLEGSGASKEITTLQNGVSITAISGAKGSERFYKVTLASNAQSLVLQMSGGTGDADLYAKRGSLPTVSSYDYRSYNGGNAESITYTNPTAGVFYIMIRSFSAYSGVSLKATYSGTPNVEPSIVTLSNNVAVTGISGARSSQRHYKITLPQNVSAFKVEMSSGSGDADLYVKKNEQPTTSNYDYCPYLSGNNETVTYASPSAGTYYIMIQGYSAYSGVRLKASYETSSGEVTVVTLQNNVAITQLSGATGSIRYFKFTVNQTVAKLTIQISGNSGDADLYTKKGALPALNSWDYRPYTGSCNETAVYSNATPGDYYIMIRGFQAYSGLKLVAKTESAPTPVTASRKALLLGLTAYDTGSNLTWTDDDADDIETVLKQLSNPYAVQKHTGRITKQQALSWVSDYRQGSLATDIFFFFYSGHGFYSGGQSYLALSDSTGISVAELKNALNQINGTKIVIIDACQSGSFTSMVTGRECTPEELAESGEKFALSIMECFEEETDRDLAEKRGQYNSPYEYYVIAGCSTSQSSYESSGFRNGYLSFFLADGMGHVGSSNPTGSFDRSYDADGYGTGGAVNKAITYREWYQYARSKVTGITSAQTVQGNHTSADFVIGNYTN